MNYAMGNHMGSGVFEMLKCILEELKEQNSAPDMEKLQYCNPDTQTLWVRYCEYAKNEVSGEWELSEIEREDLGIPCDETPVQVDIEKIRRCDETTGTIWIDYCRFITVIDENGDPQPTTDEIIKQIDTGEPCICDPMIKSFTADTWAVNAEPFNTIGVKKPECCEVTINTTSGSFTLYGDDLGFDSSEFKCPIEITGITSTCDLADVKIIIQRK